LVGLYLAGAVDFNKKSYYDIIEELISDDVPVTLFRPGMAFKVKGEADPHYLVDVNLEAMMRSDIVVFYLNDSRTCGMWMEAVWALDKRKRMVFYVEPGVHQSLYMRWVADMKETKWITDLVEFKKVLNEQIQQVNTESLTDLAEEFTLGESLLDVTKGCKGGGCHHE
jgi:hypothetical protein